VEEEKLVLSIRFFFSFGSEVCLDGFEVVTGGFVGGTFSLEVEVRLDGFEVVKGGFVGGTYSLEVEVRLDGFEVVTGGFVGIFRLVSCDSFV